MSTVFWVMFLCSSLLTCYSFNFVFFSTRRQYSDLVEDERAFVLEKFRQVATGWNQINHSAAGNGDDVGKDDRSHMIIVTDACLPLLTSGEPPMNAHLLINYELPAKKVVHFSFFIFRNSHLQQDFLRSYVSKSPFVLHCGFSQLLLRFSIFTILLLIVVSVSLGYIMLLAPKIFCRLINYIKQQKQLAG